MLEECRAKAHLKTALPEAEVSDPRHSRRKLAPRWEGLYRIVRAIRDETYTLSTMDGKILPRTWHVSNLNKFYV
ncbi:hypothetical protein BHE74_00020710 [Ensete ventricosum]|nr:hypothetical protein BHE74_00020710 [Ensete ventricosum]